MRYGQEERDYRAYISKRTCISLLFSIGFLTLILGYLLGKFVADRQFTIKAEMHRYENREKFYKWADDMDANDTTKAYAIVNSKLQFKFNNCIEDTARQKSYDLEKSYKDFIESLIDDNSDLIKYCLEQSIYK